MNDNVVVNKDNTDFNFPVSLQEDYINFIHERVGLIVKKNQKEFIKSVNQACQYFELNPYQYFDKLQQSADNSPLLGKLVSAITIDETYFFRDKNQIKLLIETILPSIINSSIQNNKKSLRVWSAGCSSGEEIYTLAMLIKELYPSIDSWTITLLATDINIDSLKKGINGKFSEWSMRSIPKKYLSKYFIKTDKVYALSEDIKKMVTFDYLNLVDDNYPSILNGTTLQDLILCRNVMIYFDNAHIKTIIERLANCVADDGYVMLGASDPIAMMGANVEIVPGVPSLFRKRPLSKAEISVPDAMPCEMLSHSKLLTASLEVNSSQVAKPKSEPTLNNMSSDEQIKFMIAESKWEEVVNAIDMWPEEKTPYYLSLKAKALANLGRTQEAVIACEECLSSDKMNKEVYFTYALALTEQKRWKDAESAYRKALYIEPNFIMCRYQFSMFLLQMKKLEEGVKSLNNTIKSAALFDPDALVPDAINTTYRQLIAIIQNEINLHS